MSEALKKVGRQTPIYMVGVIASRLAGFIMLPIYTSVLTTSDYGVLELLSITVDVMGTIGSLGIAAGVFKFHAEYDAESDKNAVVSTATIALLILTLIVASLGFAFSGVLSPLVLGEGGRTLYFQLFFAIHFCQQAEAVPLLLLRIQDRPLAFVTVGVLKLVAQLSLNIWLVVFLRMGVLGVLVSNLATGAFFSLGLTVYLFRSVGTQLSVAKIRRMARFGFPMMFWFLGNFVLVFSDRYFVNAHAGLSEVGIYSLGYRFATLISALAFGPFQRAWDPQRFELAKQPDSGDTFTRVFTYLNLLLGLAALGIALFAQDVLRIMARPEFHPAYRVVPILLLAQIIYHWVPFANLGLLLKERTHVLAIVSGASVVVVLALNQLLVPRYGVMGAAFATLGAYAIRFVLVVLPAQRDFFIRYDRLRIGRLYGILVVATAIRFVLPTMTLVASVAASGGIGLAAIGAVYLVVLEERERRFVRDVPAKVGARLRRQPARNG